MPALTPPAGSWRRCSRCPTMSARWSRKASTGASAGWTGRQTVLRAADAPAQPVRQLVRVDGPAGLIVARDHVDLDIRAGLRFAPPQLAPIGIVAGKQIGHRVLIGSRDVTGDRPGEFGEPIQPKGASRRQHRAAPPTFGAPLTHQPVGPFREFVFGSPDDFKKVSQAQEPIQLFAWIETQPRTKPTNQPATQPAELDRAGHGLHEDQEIDPLPLSAKLLGHLIGDHTGTAKTA